MLVSLAGGPGLVAGAALLGGGMVMLARAPAWAGGVVLAVGAALVVAGGLAWRRQRRALGAVAACAESLAQGRLPPEIAAPPAGDFGRIARALNSMVPAARRMVQQMQSLSRRNFHLSFQPRSADDQLGLALDRLVEDLLGYDVERRKRDWIHNALSELAAALRGNPQPEELGARLLEFLARHLNVQAAALHAMDAESTTWRRLAVHAWPAAAARPAWTAPGASRQAQFDEQVPADDPRRQAAGPGIAELGNLATIPLARGDRLVGVVELRSYDLFSANAREFLVAAAEPMAIALDAALARSRVAELLAETQRQARLLQEERARLAAANQELDRKNQQIQKDLALAQCVQRGFLPHEYPGRARVRFHCYYQPCAMLGGDMYDIFSVDTDRVGFYMADVSGHGVSAALISGMLKMAFNPQRDAAPPPGAHVRVERSMLGRPDRMLAYLNERFQTLLPDDRFVTLIYATLDLRERALSWANAGHPAPILFRAAGGTAERLDGGRGPALALFTAGGFGLQHARLALHDKLIFYTDGLTEAMNAGGDEYTEDRLLAALREVGHQEPPELAARLRAAVEEHCAGRPLDDDFSLLVVELVSG